jgi:hypothetical protein
MPSVSNARNALTYVALCLAGASQNATSPPRCMHAAGAVGGDTLFVFGGMRNSTLYVPLAAIMHSSWFTWPCVCTFLMAQRLLGILQGVQRNVHVQFANEDMERAACGAGAVDAPPPSS